MTDLSLGVSAAPAAETARPYAQIGDAHAYLLAASAGLEGEAR
jgi:hypothetical protein